MSKEIIINHSHHETRVALMEDGMLTELQYEREREQRIVGNIYNCLLYTSPSPRDQRGSRIAAWA